MPAPGSSSQGSPRAPAHRWAIRVIAGTTAGREFTLPNGNLVIGSASGSQILVPSPGIAPRHCEVHVDHASVSVRSIGGLVALDGTAVSASSPWAVGQVLEVGSIQLQLVDHAEPLRAGLLPRVPFLSAVPDWLQFEACLTIVALLLLLVTSMTGNPRLVPATVLAGAAVVPIGMLGFVHARFGDAVPSVRMILVILGLGASLGLVFTILFGSILPPCLPGLMAPLCEEPAKLIATSLCWYRGGYRNPTAGFLLGFAAGTGFAIAETAGYGLESMWGNGHIQGMDVKSGALVILLRSAIGASSHAVWAAAVASAWFQVGWRIEGRWQPVIGRALLIAILLHATWNSFGWTGIAVSYVLTTVLFVRLLRSRGTWPVRWLQLP
jgi:RsiW-degrading membrane proteinase PrsW (M82 family)